MEREDEHGWDSRLTEYLHQLATPRALGVARLFGRARETPLELRKLVPILIEAVTDQDAEPSDVRANRSPFAIGLDDFARARLQGQVNAALSAMDGAAKDLVMQADPAMDIDEAGFFADPLGNVLLHFDFAQMVSVMPEHLSAIASLPMDEQLYLWEVVRQTERPSFLRAVLRSQFMLAVSLIQPALGEALLVVLSPDREKPLSPAERTDLDHRVSQLLTRSPEHWRKALRHRFTSEILDVIVDWDELGHFWAKRNLFTHRGSLVDAPFRKAFPDGPPIGAPVDITEIEVLDAFDFAAATRLAFLVAAADLVTPSFGAQFSEAQTDFALQDLDAQRWWLAEGTARTALAFASDPSSRAVAQVNLWLAQSGRLGLDAIRAEVEAWDGEAIDPHLGLARLILLSEDEAARNMIIQLLPMEVLSREDLATWPLFKGLRDRGLLKGL